MGRRPTRPSLASGAVAPISRSVYSLLQEDAYLATCRQGRRRLSSTGRVSPLMFPASSASVSRRPDESREQGPKQGAKRSRSGGGGVEAWAVRGPNGGGGGGGGRRGQQQQPTREREPSSSFRLAWHQLARRSTRLVYPRAPPCYLRWSPIHASRLALNPPGSRRFQPPLARSPARPTPAIALSEPPFDLALQAVAPESTPRQQPIHVLRLLPPRADKKRPILLLSLSLGQKAPTLGSLDAPFSPPSPDERPLSPLSTTSPLSPDRTRSP